jgi:hypothetical protein
MRESYQFRVRTLLFVFAAVAVLAVACSWLWRRHKVDSALETVLAAESNIHWRFDPDQSATVVYLLSDLERVSRRLLAIAKTGDDLQRRKKSVQILQLLSGRSTSLRFRRQLLPQLINLACDERTPPLLVAPLGELIADLIRPAGVTIEERERIRVATMAASGDQRIAWIHVLDSIGGRDEVLLLLELGNSHDQKQLRAVSNSRFSDVIWGGMLPHLARWIRDPIIADTALEFSALSYTSDGRDELAAFLSDTTQPTRWRTKAVEQLTQTVAGIDLLASACAEARFARMLDELLGVDGQKYLAAERIKVSNYNGDELWNELIGDLDLDRGVTSDDTMYSAEFQAQLVEYQKQTAQSSLDCLRILSKNPDLTTQSEWRACFETESPDVVMLDELLRVALDYPKTMETTVMLRRIVPHHLGRIPDSCIPLYRQMLESDNVTIQYWACQALLSFTDSADCADAVHVAVEMVELSKPSDDTGINSGVIGMLRRRFAVNFLWDTDAWREWASDAHPMSPGLTEYNWRERNRLLRSSSKLVHVVASRERAFVLTFAELILPRLRQVSAESPGCGLHSRVSFSGIDHFPALIVLSFAKWLLAQHEANSRTSCGVQRDHCSDGGVSFGRL